MARRHLSIGTEEWDNLAWWERRTYLEGFEDEELVSRDGQPARHYSPDSGDRYESPPPDLASAPIGGHAALGFTELVVNADGSVSQVGRPGA